MTLPLVPGFIGRLRDGVDVADVGCGPATPRGNVGFDFSDTGIAAARKEAAREGLANARVKSAPLTYIGVDERRSPRW